MRCAQGADWARRNPFNDSLIASGSDDGKVRETPNGRRIFGSQEQAFIWKVPEGFTLRTEEGEQPADVAPVAKLVGHSR